MLAGRYRIIGQVGAGGMGAVYDVVDENLEETIALKLLHPRPFIPSEHSRGDHASALISRRFGASALAPPPDAR